MTRLSVRHSRRRLTSCLTVVVLPGLNTLTYTKLICNRIISENSGNSSPAVQGARDHRGGAEVRLPPLYLYDGNPYGEAVTAGTAADCVFVANLRAVCISGHDRCGRQARPTAGPDAA